MDFLSEERCLYCGVNEGIVDAVTNEEVIKVCSQCAMKNGFPVITKATLEQINASHKLYNKNRSSSAPPAISSIPTSDSRPLNLTTPRWVKNMNSNMAGDRQEVRKESSESIMSKIARAGNNTLDAKEVERVVDNNLSGEVIKENKAPSYSHAYSSKIGITSGVVHGSKAIEKSALPVYSDLVNNFHWHIQHGRRLKKVSQKQLAAMIAEKEEVVVLAEQGKLPEDYSKLVSKLEQFLNVRLKSKDDPVIQEQENLDDSGEASEEAKSSSGFFKSAKEYFKSWWDSEREEENKESAQDVVEEREK